MTLSSTPLRAVACAVIIIMAIPAGIVSFSAEATAQPDTDTDIRTETKTTKQLNTLRTGYDHPGLSSPRAHAAIVGQSNHEAIDGSPGGIQITPADVTLAPGGSYTLAVTIPDKGKIDDATLDITLSGADATVDGVTTLVDEGGFKTADRTALTDKRVTYEADSLTIDDTVLLTVDVPDAATDTDTVVLEAEYRAGNPLNPLKDYHVDTTTQTTYDIAGTATTYDSLATRADARADLSEQYRKAYNSIRTGQTGDFEDIFARSMVEATTAVGVEIVIGKLTGPFKKVDAALTAKDAYDTTVGNGDGGTAGDVLTSLAPVISSFGEFDQAYEKVSNVWGADRTNTSLSQLAKHQRAEADAWRNRNRKAALKAIKKQQEAICDDDGDTTNAKYEPPFPNGVSRETNPCVVEAAKNQRSAAINQPNEDVAKLGQFFKSIKSYAEEEQDYINTQLFPVAKLPSASVTTDQSHETIESELDSLAVGDQTTLEFTVTNGDAGLSANGYLSISHAQTLDIVQVTQTTGDTEEEFKRTDTTPGEKFATRNGNGRAESPLVDIVESYDQDESNTYEITVKREADGKIWLTYRSALSPVLTEEGTEDGKTFSRAPTSSDVETTDQQGWPAYRLSVTQDDEDDGDGDEDDGGGSDPVNEPPEADAGGPYELREGNSLELDASGSSDPDGGSIVSDWTLIDGPGSLNGNTYSAPSSISDDTTAKAKIEVTDNQGKSDTDTTVINLKPTDPDPTLVADAGGPYSVEAGETVNLDATGSSAPDGSIKKTEWERIDGPGSVSGSVYNAPASVSSDTTAEIKLTVTGSNGATATDTARINLRRLIVDPPQPAEIPAENALAVNGSRVYTIVDDSIRVYNLETRELITQYAAPDGTNQGLAYGDGSLWYSDADQPAYNGQLLELNPTTGEIRSRIDGLGYDPYGLAYGDGSLWAGEVTGIPNELKEYSPDGSELGGSDIEGPAGSSGPNGVAYFNGSLWIGASSDSGQALFKLGTNGNLKRTVQERSPESESGFKALAGSSTALYGPDSSGNLSVLMSLPPDDEDADGISADAALSFEQGDTGETPPAPWSIVRDPTAPGFEAVEISEQHATDGSQTLHMTGNGELDRILVGFDANLSNVETVRVDVYLERANVYIGEIWFGRRVDGESKKTVDVMGQTGEGPNRFGTTGEFTNVEGDVSDLSGEHELVFNVRGDNEAYFDEIEFLDADGNVVPAAQVVVEADNRGPPGGGDGDDSDELLSVPFKTSFETGVNGWTVNQRFRTSDNFISRFGSPTRGSGGYSTQSNGSVKLRVDGGPSTIGVARNVSGLTAGTNISVTYDATASSPQPGKIAVAVYAPDGDNEYETLVATHPGDVGSGRQTITGTVTQDYPNGTELRVVADVWPGEFTAYVTSISAQVPQKPSPSPPSIPTPPDQTGVSTGDPHIITFDGLAYDFQAAGEFTLFEDSQSVEIQARQLPVTDSDRDATVNTAIATLVDGSRVMIDARSSTEPKVIVDGTPVRVTATDPVSVGDGMIFYEEAASRYTVVYPGDDEQINDGDTQLIADIVGDRLDITVHTAPSNHDSVQGLLGDIDSDTSNDIALSNGTVLAQPPTFDSLYGPFRTSWRVTDTTSLFYYDDGNGPETYYQSDIPTAPVTIEDFPDTEILTAREKAQNAGLKSGSVNFRNAVLDYLLTGESSYFDSAQRAPKTRASNLMVPNRSEDGDGEGVPIGSNVIVDGFEDKDLTEYNDVEAATVTATTSYDGDSAVVITDRNEEMFKQNGHYTGNRIRRDLADGRPDHLAGAVRIGSGSYNDLRLYWRNETGKKVVGINLDTYRSNFYYDGTAVADISAETWYYVEFVDLDWEDNTVSKIKVDDRVVGSDVPFLSNADKIHNLTMSVNDAGTGSKAYFDEITILGEETETDIDVTRMVSSSEVSPGEKLTLTTEITGVSGSVSTSSTYEPSVASATIQSVTVNGASANPILSEATMNGTTVTLGDVGTDATVRITEELTVGEETDVTHSITGNVTAGETTTEVDPVSVTVADIEPQSVVDEYDTDNDGTISITELGAAGADFARGELSITELGRLGAEFAS